MLNDKKLAAHFLFFLQLHYLIYTSLQLYK